ILTSVRILHVDSGREWRGGQNQVRLLCRELARVPDVEQVLVTKAGGALARRAAAEGIAVRPVPWGPGLDPRAWWGLVRAVRWARPDLVHAHDSHALALAATLGRPLVATRRVDFPVRRFSAWRRVRRIVAISEAVKRVLVRAGIPPEVITVVPSGIDPDEVRRGAARRLDIRGRLGLAPATPLAVNVAALVDHKDHRTLVRAAAAARPLRPELHWVIAGEGALRGSLEAEIARLQLSDRVHLAGYLEEADALIAEATVFVMSSKEEGLGSVILNALALGKPVVATAGGGIPEILPPRALVPPGDAEALARKVVDALTLPPSPVALPPTFTAAAMAQGVLAVYRSFF
ncbi:MAG TPA: glycosyltransferase, partial [Gemmatimonadales bacterium]|nr:glycosyltransferase [Gemmatimonadales bacterium]